MDSGGEILNLMWSRRGRRRRPTSPRCRRHDHESLRASRAHGDGVATRSFDTGAPPQWENMNLQRATKWGGGQRLDVERASSCRIPFKMASQYVSAAKASEDVSLLFLFFFLEILPPDAVEQDKILFAFLASLKDVLAPLGDCNGLLRTSLLEKACKTVSSRPVSYTHLTLPTKA